MSRTIDPRSTQGVPRSRVRREPRSKHENSPAQVANGARPPFTCSAAGRSGAPGAVRTCGAASNALDGVVGGRDKQAPRARTATPNSKTTPRANDPCGGESKKKCCGGGGESKRSMRWWWAASSVALAAARSATPAPAPLSVPKQAVDFGTASAAQCRAPERLPKAIRDRLRFFAMATCDDPELLGHFLSFYEKRGVRFAEHRPRAETKRRGAFIALRAAWGRVAEQLSEILTNFEANTSGSVPRRPGRAKLVQRPSGTSRPLFSLERMAPAVRRYRKTRLRLFEIRSSSLRELGTAAAS